MQIPKFNDFVNEALKTKEIDPKKFPDPQSTDPNFFNKGKQDNNSTDDIVYTKEVGIPAKSLKASQDAVYLGKTLGMAVNGVEGGDLDAVISKDNRILDGHHRWAATMFNNPNAKVNGTRADLTIGDLIPVLRAAGDALGNTRGAPPSGGDISIFDADLDDVKKCIYDGKWMDPKFYNKEKSIKWFEKTGEEKINNALGIIKRNGPPAGAPPRIDMPKIKPNQVKQVATALDAGKIDVRAPYVDENLIPSYTEYVNESVYISGKFKVSCKEWTTEVLIASQEKNSNTELILGKSDEGRDDKYFRSLIIKTSAAKNLADGKTITGKTNDDIPVKITKI